MNTSGWIPRFRWTAFLRAVLVSMSTLVTAQLTVAAPVQYQFIDTEAGGLAGLGTFTIDIGPLLMDYEATAVAGSGTTFGTWAAVSFRANTGSFSSLVISNLVGAAVIYSTPGIGGSDIQTSSQADLEWAHFLSSVEGIGVRITPVVQGIIPEASTWVCAAALGAGVIGMRCRRARRSR